MSKNKYVIIHGQLYQISNDELMHWRYIKREKKNGKWVYTYPNDKLGIKQFIDTKITGKAYEQHAQEVAEEKRKVDIERFDTSQSRSHAEQTSKGYSQTDPKVIELKTKESELSKKSTDLDKEYAKVKADYANKSLSGTIASNVNNLKSNGKDFVDRMKDDLGFDERVRYKKLKSEYERSAERADTTFDNWMDFYKNYDYKDKRQREINTELRIAAKAARETYDQWSKKYNEAWNDYMATPLGKVSKVTTEVQNWLDDLFASDRKRR